jgi:hypothetical protein
VVPPPSFDPGKSAFTGTKSKRSKKIILMAPGPVPSWEKWVLNGWIDPEETTRERLLESLKNNDGIYPWTGYSER